MTTRYEYEQRRMELANHILAHPNEFNMRLWGVRGGACGTQACLAGTAALLAEQKGLCYVEWFHWGAGHANTMSEVRTADRVEDVDRFAANYLGLPDTRLFYLTWLDEEEAAKTLLDYKYLKDAA